MLRFKSLILLLFVYSFSFGATFVVDNNSNLDDLLAYTAGDGTNSLRKCVRLANANAGADIINFNIVGSTLITNNSCFLGGWFTITDPVTIDGYTQPGAAAGSPQIELNGSSTGCVWTINLTTGSAGSVIRGLIIYGTNIGIRMDANTSGNTVSGCWIGVNNTGNAAAPNPITEHGIRMEGSDNNLIGGSGGLIDRNVISSCAQEGIRIDVAPTTGNTINGNYIGVGADGTTDLGNRSGIHADNSIHFTVGGGNANEGNVISGNSQRGILLVLCDTFYIKGNVVGLGADQSTIISNNLSGIEAIVGCDSAQIGGPTLNERNIVSGNSQNGMRFDDANNMTIQGNYIGVAGDGLTGRGNGINGIIGTHCEFMTVGGDATGEGNVVSANGAHGISIFAADSRNALIQGNMIGVSADGLTALGNTVAGIDLNENENSQIGGLTLAARNVIANNGQHGIFLANSPDCIIQNNYVGVDGAGLVDMGNGLSGIFVLNSPNLLIGGTVHIARNIVGGNFQNGILLEGTSANAVIKGNFVGVGADGVTLVNNDQHGIMSQGAAHGMTVGGPTIQERNVLSGNGTFIVDADPDNGLVGDGVRMIGTDNHVIQNNYIGTDSTGTIGIGNHWAGVSINDDSDNNDIIDNLISDNRNEGIWVWNGSDGNEFYRNVVGEASDGSALGNWDFGVMIDFGGSSGNIFGGSAPNANTIAHTRGERPGVDGDGLTVASGAGNDNTVTFNNIHCNVGKGIVRLGSSNAVQAAPVIVSSNTNDLNGTGDDGRTVHIYRNLTAVGAGCDCEAESYIGSTSVSGGVWSFTHNLGLTAAEAAAISATQTTSGGSTSEIGTCLNAVLPVSLLEFNGERQSDGSVLLQWSTAQEINHDYFKLHRSEDGQIWESIAKINGAGNATQTLYYNHLDPYPEFGESGLYYRLELVDQNALSSYSNRVHVSSEPIGTQFIQIYPNPVNHQLHVLGDQLEKDGIRLYDIMGKAQNHRIRIDQVHSQYYLVDVSALPPGTYLMVSGRFTEKFIKQSY